MTPAVPYFTGNFLKTVFKTQFLFLFTGKANRAYQPYQHRGDSSDGECDEDTAEFQPNRHQHSLQHQYHRHRRPNHTYQQPGALLNTDTSGTSGNCSDATLTDSELAFTRDATLQLHDGGKSDVFCSHFIVISRRCI